MQIFLYETYNGHETLKKRGSLIKVINILISLSIEFAIEYEKPNIIISLLEKYSRIFKYFLVVCENVRDSTLSPYQQTTIISNILYPLHFLYVLVEKYKDKEIISKCLINQIEDMVMFKIFLLDQLNIKIGGFQNYNELKSNMFSNLYLSNQIPISNLFTFEIFTNFLLNNNNI